MIKILVVFIFCFSILNANIKNATASYDISYGIFGILGKAKAKITTDKDNKYTIKVKAYATGFSKVLSGNLVETYVSKGIYKNNKFQPKYFKKITSQNDTIKTYEYIFDYTNQKINLKYTKKYKYYPNNDIVDNILDISYGEDFQWKVKTKISSIKYWADEDILSLFFNINHYISNINKQTTKQVRAVGAGSKQKGKIDIIIPDTKTKQKIKELLGEDENILIVKIYKDIFASKNGELLMSLNNNGLAKKTILKDVLFFGDIIGTLK